MIIKFEEGRFGSKDKKILFSSTDRQGNFIKNEPVSIFKIALLVNQLTWNELNTKDGLYKRMLEYGKPLFFKEAIKESIEMAISGINWAEDNSLPFVEEWAKKWMLRQELVESNLQRTFQKGLHNYTGDKK